MATRQNTFEKRRPDMEKKLRAEDKRRKRQQKNAKSSGADGTHPANDERAADAGQG